MNSPVVTIRVYSVKGHFKLVFSCHMQDVCSIKEFEKLVSVILHLHCNLSLTDHCNGL
jgi:hypothetical protein